MSSATPRHSISIHLVRTDFSVRFPSQCWEISRDLWRMFHCGPQQRLVRARWRPPGIEPWLGHLTSPAAAILGGCWHLDNGQDTGPRKRSGGRKFTYLSPSHRFTYSNSIQTRASMISNIFLWLCIHNNRYSFNLDSKPFDDWVYSSDSEFPPIRWELKW